MELRNVIERNVLVMMSTGTIRDAARMMSDNSVGSIVIVDSMNGSKGRPVGIVTDRDIALSVARGESFDAAAKIGTVMTKTPVVCNEDEGLFKVIRKMKENGIMRVPVVDENGRLEGILSGGRLLSLLAEEIHNLSEISGQEIEKEKGIKKKTEKNLELDLENNFIF